ncbi:hypothetical protein [Sporosarcina sp. ANT_H38]|nr:hypothetical protein [Sporosarcina sp. ANT_H38]
MHICKNHKVKNYTKMNKTQLIEAVNVILNRHNE